MRVLYVIPSARGCEMKGLLSVKEVAEMLSMRESTIRAWILRRRFPVVHCGRSVRIPFEAVQDFIRRNTLPAREDQ